MKTSHYLVVLTAFLCGCETIPEYLTTPDFSKAQTRLDAISTPLMSAWEAHCETGFAGLKSGLKSESSRCRYDVLVREDNVPNAYADGEHVFVTSGMVSGFSDLSLSLVIAHEMAHNVLGHVDQDIAESREREADRWALYLLEATGLDYEKAAHSSDAVHAPDTKNTSISAIERRRADHFDVVITELKSRE